AELAEHDPMMGIYSNPLWVGEATDGEQHHPPAPLGHGVGDRERKAATAAHDRERAFSRHCGAAYVAHGSSPAWARRMHMGNGREPARMKATTLATSGSLTLCATVSSRSRNVPAPKNMAS